MANLLKGAVFGLVALGGLAAASSESSAMPVGNLAPVAATETGAQVGVDKVYWRYGYGWRRPWGWRRPFYGYGWGWRRPFYGYGYGWRRPYYGGWGWRRRYW